MGVTDRPSCRLSPLVGEPLHLCRRSIVGIMKSKDSLAVASCEEGRGLRSSQWGGGAHQGEADMTKLISCCRQPLKKGSIAAC